MKLLADCRGELYRRMFRTIEVPGDLADLTDIDSESEIDPAAADLSEAAVRAIWDATQALYRTGVYPLLSICLRRHGHRRCCHRCCCDCCFVIRSQTYLIGQCHIQIKT